MMSLMNIACDRQSTKSTNLLIVKANVYFSYGSLSLLMESKNIEHY